MEQIRKFYRLLGHSKYTEIRAIYKGNIKVEFVDNEDDFVKACAKYNGEYNVYAGVNEREIKGKGSSADIKKITDICLDIEYEHPKDTMIKMQEWEYVLQTVSHTLESYKYDNVFAVASGNGVQLHFKIKPNEPTMQLQMTHKKYIEQWRSILPENIRVDAVHDFARIMRVPGTFNLKGGEKRAAYIWRDGTGTSSVFKSMFGTIYKSVTSSNTATSQNNGRGDASSNGGKPGISNERETTINSIIDKFPCWKALFSTTDIPQGEHHHSAVRLISFLKQEGCDDEEVFEFVNRWDENNNKYLGSQMVRQLIWKQQHKFYPFQCNDALLKKYCSIEGCAKREIEDEYVPLVDISHESENYLGMLASKPPEGAPEILTGFPKLDKKMWGLRRGELTVIAAYTSVGKTAAACQLASTNARRNYRVLYVSSESKYNEILNRMLSDIYNIDSFKFRNGTFTPEDRAVIKNSSSEVSKWKLWVCDEPSPTRHQVEMAIRAVKPDMIVLDYIQRCNYDDAPSERQGLQMWMKDMKTFAQRYNVATVVLSQIRRRQDADSDPNLWDMFGSGSLEFEADNVILLHANKSKTDSFSEDKYVNWIIAKGRNIGTSKHLFKYIGQYVRFTEAEDSVELP